VSWAEEEPRTGRDDASRVSCFGCVHLVTTYERGMPYACRLIGMKSRMLPSIEVRRETGEDCKGFERREHRREQGRRRA